MDGTSGVAVAKVTVDQPEIVAPIRECEATGVPEHVNRYGRFELDMNARLLLD
jgi:hypothetical protein